MEGNLANQQKARAAGCIPWILQSLTDSENPFVRVAAADSLECLVRSCPENKADVVEQGGVAALARLLKDENPQVRRNSSIALGVLCQDHPAALVAVREGKEGTMETLCKLLWNKDGTVVHSAIEALCTLAEGGVTLHGVKDRLRELLQSNNKDIRALAERAISITEQRDQQPPTSAFLDSSDKHSSPKKRPIQAATSSSSNATKDTTKKGE